MKLVVLIVGLSALVPINDQEILVLLPEASTHSEWKISGHQPLLAMAHQSEIAWVDQQALDPAFDPLTFLWEPVALEGDLVFQETGAQSRTDWHKMIDMTELLGSVAGAGAVKADCIDIDGCSEAVARIQLIGGEVTAGSLRLVPGIEGDTPGRLGFRTDFQGLQFNALELPADSEGTVVCEPLREGTSALLFEADTDQSDSFSLTLGDQEYALSPTTCEFAGIDDCFFVRIWNVPEDYLTPSDCSPRVGDVDTHFAHFFRLLESEPSPVRLPRIATKIAFDTGNKPSIQCPNVKLALPSGGAN